MQRITVGSAYYVPPGHPNYKNSICQMHNKAVSWIEALDKKANEARAREKARSRIQLEKLNEDYAREEKFQQQVKLEKARLARAEDQWGI